MSASRPRISSEPGLRTANSLAQLHRPLLMYVLKSCVPFQGKLYPEKHPMFDDLQLSVVQFNIP